MGCTQSKVAKTAPAPLVVNLSAHLVPLVVNVSAVEDVAAAALPQLDQVASPCAPTDEVTSAASSVSVAEERHTPEETSTGAPCESAEPTVAATITAVSVHNAAQMDRVLQSALLRHFFSTRPCTGPSDVDGVSALFTIRQRSRLLTDALAVAQSEIVKSRRNGTHLKSILKRQSPRTSERLVSIACENDVVVQSSPVRKVTQDVAPVPLVVRQASPLATHCINVGERAPSPKNVCFDRETIRRTAPVTEMKQEAEKKKSTASSLTQKQKALMKTGARSTGRKGPVAGRWGKSHAQAQTDVYMEMARAFERQLTNVQSLDAHLDTR